MTRGVRWYLVGSLVLVALAGCGRWIAEREPWRHEAEEQCLKSGAVRESPSVAILKPIAGPGVCGADFPLRVGALGDAQMLGYADEPLRPPGVIPQSGSSRPPYASPPPYSPAPGYPPPSQSYPSSQSYPAPQSYPPRRQQGYPSSPVQSYPMPPPPGSAQSAAPPPYSPYGAPRYAAPPSAEPLRITPPGLEPPPSDPPGSYAVPMPDYGARSSPRPYPPRVPVARQPAPGGDDALAADPMLSPSRMEQLAPYPPRYPPNGESVPLGPARGPQVTGAAGAAAVSPPATLACPVVSALDRWVSESVQPAAMRWFGASVVEIKQISAYSCRGMNGNPNAHISEHAFGNALDIAAFVLSDGRTIAVKNGWRGAPEQQGFLRDVQGGACERFNTVLAPGSNVYHYDHIHVDLMRRASGRRICQPAAIPGEVVAGRARGGSGYAGGRGDPGITGSIASRRAPAGRRHPDARFEDDPGLPSAVPGED